MKIIFLLNMAVLSFVERFFSFYFWGAKNPLDPQPKLFLSAKALNDYVKSMGEA